MDQENCDSDIKNNNCEHDDCYANNVSISNQILLVIELLSFHKLGTYLFSWLLRNYFMLEKSFIFYKSE